MCLQTSSVARWQSWNWSGDEIVHSPIVPASRTIPGKKKRYPIDIREFLTTTNNAVVHRSLNDLIQSLAPAQQSLFRSHSRGSFDFRADQVTAFVGRLKYLPKANLNGHGPDAWLYPDETLAQGGGDCEDLAFLMAALLMTAGISSYCVRVALGHLEIALPGKKTCRHDHSWVMYQNEGGAWEILEPLRITARPSTASKAVAQAALSPSTTYVPHYVFNTDHLWLIRSPALNTQCSVGEYCKTRTFWKRFDPAFAASVHSTIFDRALSDLIDTTALSRIKRKSLWLDANILAYDPRDHFDNAFIAEGWDRVNQRLAVFSADGTDWESFGAAAHAIGDFYAHSSYLHFAALQNPGSPRGSASPYEPGVPMAATPRYTSQAADPALAPFDITSDRFSVNRELWKGAQWSAAASWAGKIISGRYAQKHDPRATFWEGFTSIPLALANAPTFPLRGSVPHHDEIAVDDQSPGRRHKLYSSTSSSPTDRQGFANQFRWRVNTAVAHIRQAFLDATQEKPA